MQITDAELDSYLQQLVQDAQAYTPRAWTSFSTLYETGIRAEELDLERWSYDAISDTFILTTLKSQNIRIFTRTELPLLFQRAVQLNQPAFILNSYSSLEYTFRNLARGRLLFTAQKRLLTHAFRHNRAKQVFNQTGSYVEVQQYFNLQDLSVATAYVTTPIQKNF